MYKRIHFAEDKDLGKIIYDAFLFFKQQFWNYLNCLFIITAPFFILFMFAFHEIGHSDLVYFLKYHWMSAGSISAVFGILFIFNVSAIYMVIYNEGKLKIKVSDIIKKVSDTWSSLLSYHFSLLVFLTFIGLLAWFIFNLIENSKFYYFYLSTILVFGVISLPLLYFLLNASLIKAIRDNHGFAKSTILIFLYLKKNWILTWAVTLLGLLLALILRYFPVLSIWLLFYLGGSTKLFNLNDLMLEFRTISIVILIVLSIFGIYLATFILILHQILFFSLEEKYKGRKVIEKINNIGV